MEGCPLLTHQGLRAVAEGSVEARRPLLAALQVQLMACRRLGLLAEPAVTEFALTLGAAKEKPKKAKAGAAVAPTGPEAGAAGAQEEEPG